jgi:hypothetical protein
VGTKGAQKRPIHTGVTGDDDSRLGAYITQLKADYGSYALPAKDARRIVDESLGECSLTDLLYTSRGDGVK